MKRREIGKIASGGYKALDSNHELTLSRGAVVVATAGVARIDTKGIGTCGSLFLFQCGPIWQAFRTVNTSFGIRVGVVALVWQIKIVQIGCNMEEYQGS